MNQIVNLMKEQRRYVTMIINSVMKQFNTLSLFEVHLKEYQSHAWVMLCFLKVGERGLNVELKCAVISMVLPLCQTFSNHLYVVGCVNVNHLMQIREETNSRQHTPFIAGLLGVAGSFF